MRLHEYKNEFNDLISIVANKMHLPESAVERDYYIVLLLDNLAASGYAEQCVFKGGTSLSKCYPNTIDRFSEDIDLTFLGMNMTDKECDKAIKQIEDIMTMGANTEKIVAERSKRSKSMYVWFDDKDKRVKLEIGSNIKPDPYSKKTVKSYIHEFLEELSEYEDIEKYELTAISLNVLNIERTFLDKIMAVKRHALCGTLDNKVRHIYDVVKLFDLHEIKDFLHNESELRRLIKLTKETDSFYLGKRGISADYDPREAYNFNGWKDCFSNDIRAIYQGLHETLLYTDERQDFNKAINTFIDISEILSDIGE